MKNRINKGKKAPKKYSFRIDKEPKENQIKSKTWKRLTGLNKSTKEVPVSYPQIVKLALPEIRLLTSKKLGEQIEFPHKSLSVPKKLKKISQRFWLWIQQQRKNKHVKDKQVQPYLTPDEGKFKKLDKPFKEKTLLSEEHARHQQMLKEHELRNKRKGVHKTRTRKKFEAARKEKSKEFSKIYALQKTRKAEQAAQKAKLEAANKVVQMSSPVEKTHQAKAA